MKITVMVPVYREPKRVGDILSKILVNNYPDREVIVVVDGITNPAIESAIDPHRNWITVHYNGEQLGKTESLNRIAFMQKTDIFLMLDNDIELPDDSLYLKKISVWMEKYDLLEIPKEAIQKNLISRMMAIEFLSRSPYSTFSSCATRSTSLIKARSFSSSLRSFVSIPRFHTKLYLFAADSIFVPSMK